MQYYFSSALVTAIAVGVLGYGMSTVWATTRMDCAQSEDDISNGTAGTVVVTLELFDGTFEMISCPFTGEPDYFQGNFLNRIPVSEIYLSICLSLDSSKSHP